MHIVLDKVVYPIDWKQLDMNPYNIAVGVKFKIGELQVTPNRESLRYTDEIIALLKERIQLTINELISIFDKQNKQFDSFFEWLEKKDQKPFISFTKENGEIDKLYLYGLEHVNKKNTYKYFEGIEDIIQISDLLSLFYGYVGEVKNGKKKKHNYVPNITNKIKYVPSTCFIGNNSYNSSEKDWLIKDGHILYPKLNLRSVEEIFLTRVDKSNYWSNRYFNLGAGLKLYKLMKALREEVNARCRTYRSLTSEELIEYKEYKKENDTNLQRKLNGKVLVNSISEKDKYDWNLNEINSYKGIVIYGFTEDQDKLEKVITIISQVRNNYLNGYSRIRNKICRVIRISKQNEKYFKKRNNMYHVDDFFDDNPIFRDMASSFKIEYFFNDIKLNSKQDTEEYINQIKLICSDIGEVLDELYKYYSKTNSSTSYIRFTRNDIRKEVMQIAEKYNLYNPNIELLFSKINAWFRDVEIIRYVNINDKTLPFVLKLLYEKKKRLNVEYYQRVLNTDKSTQLKIDFDKKEQAPISKFKFITQNVIV